MTDRLFTRPKTDAEWRTILESGDAFSGLFELGLVLDIPNPYEPEVCWPWAQSVHENGTARVYFRGKMRPVRRLFARLLGKLGEGSRMHLSCGYGTPSCCRPSHIVRTIRHDLKGKPRGRRT